MKTLETIKKYFGLVEFYLIKIIGWIFLSIGLYNLIGYYNYFFEENMKKYVMRDSGRMNFLFYFELTFIFIPIIIGGLLILKTNSLKSNKNE